MDPKGPDMADESMYVVVQHAPHQPEKFRRQLDSIEPYTDPGHAIERAEHLERMAHDCGRRDDTYRTYELRLVGRCNGKSGPPPAPGADQRREAAYAAVYEVIRQYPPRSTDSYGQAAENARVWRAVHAALEALAGVRNAAELGEAGAAHIRAEADKITAARTRPAASTSSAADVDTSDQADALRHAVRAVRAPLDEAPAVADSATRASSTGSYLAALHEGMREFDAERGRRDAP